MLLWVGRDLMLPFQLVVAFSIFYFIQTSGDIKSVYMNAKGLWWENRYRTILESIFNLIFSWLFIHWLGVLGAVIGPMLSLLIFNFGMSTTIMYKYCFPHFPLSDFFKQYINYIVVTAIAGGISIIIINSYKQYITSNWWTLLATCVVSVIVPNIIYSLFYSHYKLYPDAKKFVIQLIKRK